MYYIRSIVGLYNDKLIDNYMQTAIKCCIYIYKLPVKLKNRMFCIL